MKKCLSLLLISFLLIGVLAGCGATRTDTTLSSETSESKQLKIGTLTLLNMDEENYKAVLEGRIKAIQYLEKQEVMVYDFKEKSDSYPRDKKIIFYDTLDALLVALEAGEIDSITVPECTADYLCAQNTDLRRELIIHEDKADTFSKGVLYRLGNGFSFMMKDNNTELRDEFDAVIADMKSDGTLDKLVKEYITEATSNSEQKKVEFTKNEGDTIKIAVTGVLPPMDYVAPDGTFAGFNTAILAEIGKRLGKNIELVQVDSVGRAAALASGQVDAVFWTKGAREETNVTRSRTKEEQDNDLKEKNFTLTDEQREVVDSLDEVMNYQSRDKDDLPEGTIITQQYYNTIMIPVCKK